jgi:hypothetical protein
MTNVLVQFGGRNSQQQTFPTAPSPTTTPVHFEWAAPARQALHVHLIISAIATRPIKRGKELGKDMRWEDLSVSTRWPGCSE